MGKIPNSPLIEAIFELKWGEKQPGHFEYSKEEKDFFPGVFYDAIKKEEFSYSEHVGRPEEQLNLPFQVAHRFRKSEGQWPCYQIGLGIFTANQIGNMSVGPDGIGLKYQDGFILEDGETIESFISKKLKTNIDISSEFLSNDKISKSAENIRLRISHRTLVPSGSIAISVLSAQFGGKPGLVIETEVFSQLGSSERKLDFLAKWCEEAHDLQRHAFNTVIKTENL